MVVVGGVVGLGSEGRGGGDGWGDKLSSEFLFSLLGYVCEMVFGFLNWLEYL